MTRLTATLVATLMCAAAQGRPASEPSAVVVAAVAPDYFSLANLARVTGTVIVRVTIDGDGRPGNPTVVSSASRLLEKTSIDAARLWRFKTESAGSSADLAFVYRLVPENACAQRTLPRFLPPFTVEVARRELRPPCHDCGPEKPVVYEVCE